MIFTIIAHPFLALGSCLWVWTTYIVDSPEQRVSAKARTAGQSKPTCATKRQEHVLQITAGRDARFFSLADQSNGLV